VVPLWRRTEPKHLEPVTTTSPRLGTLKVVDVRKRNLVTRMPHFDPVEGLQTHEIDDLVALLRHRKLAVLTGAGCSTPSGIPDYRGPDTKRPLRRQTQHQEFIRDVEVRRRYWSRSLAGWPRIARARPNAAHTALAVLETLGQVTGIITQNVDGLHRQAGSARVVELHGSLAAVICLDCDDRSSRAEFQNRLLARNPDWASEAADITAPAAPDGDADIVTAGQRTKRQRGRFEIPGCVRCGGTLMPDVVFFGGSVPRKRADDAWRILDDSDALLAVGTSLTVYSGFRFVRAAADRGLPVALVNLGPTRGDELAQVRIRKPVERVMPRVTERLQRARSAV